jgi:hypothetical protein
MLLDQNLDTQEYCESLREKTKIEHDTDLLE